MSENPYAPPGSPVADIESSAPIERPLAVRTALVLLWISLVLALPLAAEAFLQQVHGGRGGSPSVYYAFMAFFAATTLGLIAWVIVSIGRARNWARIVYAALTATKLVSLFNSFPGILDRPWYSGPVELASTMMELAAVVLLFLPVANAWFRMHRRHRADGSI